MPQIQKQLFNDTSMSAKFHSLPCTIGTFDEACSRFEFFNAFQWLSKLCRSFRSGFFNDTSMGAKF